MEATSKEQSAVGVGQVARALILRAHSEGKNISNEDLAARVVKIFEDAGVAVTTSAASIAWYKNDLRKKGRLPGGARSAKSIEFDVDNIEL